MTAAARIGIALALAALALGGCGGGDGEGTGEADLDELGSPEGSLDLIALPGYVEDGSRDPGLDWVTPFEKKTGCEVSTTLAESPDEVVRLMRSGNFDGVSARGDVSLRLVADGLVDPLNTELIPNYSDLFPRLKDQPHNTVDGATYGIPQGRFANLLMWRTAEVPTDPEEELSSNLIFDPELASRYPGRVTILDSPMSIADAALYLREHSPDLGIENVYALDQEQFDAALELLRKQRRFVGRYWSDPAENVNAFASGASLAGTAWLVSAIELRRRGVKINAVVPEEGSTGLSDSWMLSSDAPHPNCMYLWMDWIIGPRANAAVATNTHQAPANERACNLIGVHCDTHAAADEELYDQVEYWTTPLRDCGDDRGAVCKTYDEWARGFAEVKRGDRAGTAR